MKRLTPKQREALTLIAERRIFPDLIREDDGWHARWRALAQASAADADNPWVDTFVREATVTPLSADAEDQRHETLHDAWLMALRSHTGLIRWDDRECEAFAQELADWHGGAAEDIAARASICFNLESSPTLRQDAATPTAPAPLRESATPMAQASPFLLCCEAPRSRRALRALGQAAFIFPPLRSLRATPTSASAPTGVAASCRNMSRLIVTLSQAEAESFLRAGARDLRAAGYTTRGDNLAATIAAEVELGTPGTSPTSPGELSAGPSSSAVGAKLLVRVDGEVVGVDELRFLLEQKSTLVFFRDRWIEVDRNVLKEALRALERHEDRTLTRNEAMRFALGIGAVGRLDIAEARAHGWLRGLINELRGKEFGEFAAERGSAPQARGTNGAANALASFSLRPYQRRGVAWIRFLTDYGFGALLADDMGLGKTLQTIAWLAELAARTPGPQDTRTPGPQDTRTPEPQDVRTSGPAMRTPGNQTIKQSNNPNNPTIPSLQPSLVVAPLTLVSNWRHELAKFAPGLRVYVHQGEGRQLEYGFRRTAEASDVVVTSYSLLVRDYAILRKVAWSALVLDEAQVIKNPDTQVARAVRALGVPRRLALTGTPVENSVADIWSLEEFLNPGFLGDRKSFTDRFVKPIALDERSRAAKRLREALEPFVLRRLKSDKEIASELGEKREIKEYCLLSPRQRADYEQALADYRAGERRQGDVFALITRLKLICDGAGKFERLVELLTAIFEAGESALIFTQYAKVGASLQHELAKRFGRTFPFLHGGLSAAAREKEIAAFNAPSTSHSTSTSHSPSHSHSTSHSPSSSTAFILSLKAGGFGLNLTKATHVIHFDRWWNPAVEAQATDRAHRIGQDKTVFVHQFITEGTLEEHVDEILERKSRVAGTLVTSGESFLLSLADDELGAVLKLD